jgi:hypothetical protein
MTAVAVTQETQPIGAQVGPLLYAKSVATNIPASGNTDILEFPTLGLKNVGLVILPTTNDLDAFIISAKFHPNDVFHSIYSAITSAPGGLVIAASGTLASLAAAATGWLILDVRGIYAIKVTVSGTVADTTGLTVYASGSR